MYTHTQAHIHTIFVMYAVHEMCCMPAIYTIQLSKYSHDKITKQIIIYIV